MAPAARCRPRRAAPGEQLCELGIVVDFLFEIALMDARAGSCMVHSVSMGASINDINSIGDGGGHPKVDVLLKVVNY